MWTRPKIARVLKTHNSYCSYQMHVVIVVVLSKHVVELFTLTFIFLGSNEPGSLQRSSTSARAEPHSQRKMETYRREKIWL